MTASRAPADDGPGPALDRPIAAPEAIAKKLAKIGLVTEADLVLHLPLRYEDETRVTAIAAARDGEPVQIEVVVHSSDIAYRPRRQLVVRASDASGEVWLRFFNFYPSQRKALAEGATVRAFGELRTGFFGAEMVHPRFRVLRADEPLPQALTPIYPTTAGVSQYAIRRLVESALARADTGDALTDTLPEALREGLGLVQFREAILALHRPAPHAAIAPLVERTHPAWRRIKFDELLGQQLSMRAHYRAREKLRAVVLRGNDRLTGALLARLPFKLTAAQARAWDEIRRDIARAHPMNRLLQGDVGSGKTIVSALAALRAVESGLQAAVMAPTELLAEQHYRKFAEWIGPLGVEIAWLTGRQRRAERNAALRRIAAGEIAIAVGTHALFQDKVEFARLGLAIVDEQHRFGVRQRLALRDKGQDVARAGTYAHQLMMSATPIPRTLAMSHYADLDVSVIDELPPGRTPIVTKLIAESRRDDVIERLREACAGGAQAYWVCPLIEESEELDLQTAIDTRAQLAAALPGLAIGLVHGRLPGEEKAQVMADFAAGRLQVLVATTVIEVGVDVPNASMMIIEHAERFGLAQLHQLRGRVGRGSVRSVCLLLFHTPLSEMARERLRVIYETTDGFALAEADLQMRGPGELLGARQSGVPLLRFADLAADEELLIAARGLAETLLDRHPGAAAAHMARWMGGRADLLKA